MAVLADDRIDGLSVGESSSGAWVVLGLQGVCECTKQLGGGFVRIHLDGRVRRFSPTDGDTRVWISLDRLHDGAIRADGRRESAAHPIPCSAMEVVFVINILLGDSEGEGAASRVVCVREERERENRKG